MTRDEVMNTLYDAIGWHKPAKYTGRTLKALDAVATLYNERDALTERLKAVEAENERLRCALESMLTEADEWGIHGDNPETDSRIDAAREALKRHGERATRSAQRSAQREYCDGGRPQQFGELS